jgi:hypothetical protein
MFAAILIRLKFLHFFDEKTHHCIYVIEPNACFGRHGMILQYPTVLTNISI